MKQIRLNGQQVQSLLSSGEVVVRKPVRPGRGQNWLRQPMIDEVKEVEFDGGDWLTLKHPAGEGNLTCIRNVVGKAGDLRAHRTMTIEVVKVWVERRFEWDWVIWLRRIEKEAANG